MIYFTLPNFFEFQQVNHFLITVSKSTPQVLRDPVTFIQTSGNFTYNYWTGSYCNMSGPGSYHKDFIAAANGAVMLPLRLLADNIGLEDFDYDNVMNKNILDANANSSNIIEISNISLMDYIEEHYPNGYKYTFSKQADFITPFTSELINQLIDFNRFQYIGVPDRLAADFDFLESIDNRNKLEITVNPKCPVTCRHYEECQIGQHVKQLDFSATDSITTCRNNCLNKKVISLEDIKKDYIPRGINHFTFSQQNANFATETDIISFYLFYFVKPEHQFSLLLQWQKFKENGGIV